jgi:hypothetical protein
MSRLATKQRVARSIAQRKDEVVMRADNCQSQPEQQGA